MCNVVFGDLEGGTPVTVLHGTEMVELLLQALLFLLELECHVVFLLLHRILLFLYEFLKLVFCLFDLR